MISGVPAPYLPSYQIGAIELQLYYSYNNLIGVLKCFNCLALSIMSMTRYQVFLLVGALLDPS